MAAPVAGDCAEINKFPEHECAQATQYIKYDCIIIISPLYALYVGQRTDFYILVLVAVRRRHGDGGMRNKSAFSCATPEDAHDNVVARSHHCRLTSGYCSPNGKINKGHYFLCGVGMAYIVSGLAAVSFGSELRHGDLILLSPRYASSSIVNRGSMRHRNVRDDCAPGNLWKLESDAKYAI